MTSNLTIRGRTEEQLEEALAALRNPSAPVDDVFAAIGLAELSLRIEMGEASEDDWTGKNEPDCICPPDLVARGGFKGGCPVHG